jgi:hypothetical protein
MAEQKDPAAENRERQLKATEEQRQKNFENAERMAKAKPTPTQEENDRARLGEDVAEKQDDGSGPEVVLTLQPKEQKQVEAKPAGAGYQTRQVQPKPPAA